MSVSPTVSDTSILNKAHSNIFNAGTTKTIDRKTNTPTMMNYLEIVQNIKDTGKQLNMKVESDTDVSKNTER